MEPSKEAITVRVSRLNNQVLGKSIQNKSKTLVTRESLLDVLVVLYDECNNEALKRSDKYISQFVDKFKSTIQEIKQLRVNISDFEVKNVIGRGHFGEVHVVREKQTGDVYAMKTIKKSDSLNHQSSSYEEERDIMSFCQSFWLTSLQYAFQDSCHLYLVMEYHPGGDLYCLLDRQGGTLSESHATFYISELIQAINALHSMGYVHRDVKPDNVLLDRCGHLKLADFGSAAKLGSDGCVNDKDVISVGTPDYVAPEVLQSNDKSSKNKVSYGMGCDYWSLGVLAYEITLGHTPFNGPTLSATYNKIMNFSSNLKIPTDSNISETYINLIKGLLTDQKSRLGYKQILNHRLFKETDWTNLRGQVPPFVPKVNSVDDTSNFLDVESKKSTPCIDNFKSKTQFSGRNLPFVGFTYVQELPEDTNISVVKKSDDSLLETKKKQVENLQKRLAKVECCSKEFEGLEKKFEECSRKLESVESVRNGLEKDLASSIAENSALRRTLDLERRERKEVENRALELIKSAKLKWEFCEKERIEKLNEEIEKHTTRITELCTNNNELTSKLERYKNQLQTSESELAQLRKSQADHKESLAKARAQSRRSVAGFEDKLVRMTSDSQTQISELQTKLSNALHSNTQLENELDSVRKHSQDLEDQNNLSTELCNNLKKHLDINSKRCKELETEIIELQNEVKNIEILKEELKNCKKEIDTVRSENKSIEQALKQEKEESKLLKKQLNELNNNLSESLVSSKTILAEKEAKSQALLENLQQQLKTVTEEREILNKSLQEAQDREHTNKIKVQSLEQLLSRLESGVTKLESSSEREAVLQEQVQRLEQQIKELHESSALEKQQLRSISTTLWRKEKELSNSLLDKRIIERELKEAEDKIKAMDENMKKIGQEMAQHKQNNEELLSEVKETNHSLLLEVKELEKAIIELEQKSESFKQKYEQEKVITIQKNKELDVALQTVENLRNQIASEINCKQFLEKELQNFKENNNKLQRDIEIGRKTEFDMKNELESYKQELDRSQLNINVLRDACTLLENQLEEYENLTTAHETKQSKLESHISQLNSELSVLLNETQQLKRLLNEEKSLKFAVETKVKRLQEDVDLLKNECSSYKEQVSEYKDLASTLSEDLAMTEERNSELEASLKNLERTVASLQSDNFNLKEETSQRLTNIYQLREQNYNLCQEIQDCKDANNCLSSKILELEENLNEQNNFYKQRELKTDATIQQQIKLIDFLQSKVEDCKKKKTLTDKIFGSKKENIPPNFPHNYKDLENLLSKEREINRNLREQIIKLRSESLSSKVDSEEIRSTPPNSPRSKLAMEQLVRSPASQNAEFQRKPSVQRMHHNIPHRFESRLCKKSSKCIGCSDSLQIGRSISSCSECNISVHSKCTNLVPRTCGLPSEYANHFKRTLSKSSQNSTTQCSKSLENISVESYVKIPTRGNLTWEKKYARLEGSILSIYEHKPSGGMSPLEKIELCPEDGFGVLCDDIQAQEVGNTASTDLPFIIRVDVHPKTTCWPAKNHFIMTLNASDKENWITALTELFANKYPDIPRNNYKTILKFSKNLNPVCVKELNKSSLLFGCENGLFSSYQNNPLLQISGPDNIQQISVIKSINTVLFIAENNRNLVRCELRQLESLVKCLPCTNPTLNTTIININNRDGFHIFEISDFKKSYIVCAATSKQLFIIKYEIESNDFVPLRTLDTAEPCSCILFNNYSVIVGANKFFEIDLKSFSADEFLDASDHRLKHAVNSYKLGSYPVSILLINSNPVEYLICFSEFGVFVDEYGRKNRESEIKWSHLPINFIFIDPFLYVIQFSAIEIIRISTEFDEQSLQDWITPDSVRLEFEKPKYLGFNKKGIYVFVNNEVIFINAREICNDSFTENELSDSDTGTEFSFTSSMVQSLDGNSNDDEGDRKVTFNS